VGQYLLHYFRAGRINIFNTFLFDIRISPQGRGGEGREGEDLNHECANRIGESVSNNGVPLKSGLGVKGHSLSLEMTPLDRSCGRPNLDPLIVPCAADP